MKLGFFELEPWEKEIFSTAFPHDQLTFSFERLTANTVSKYAQLEIVSVFVHSKIDVAVLNKLPRLKLIATRSTGYDHIDLAECKKRNIVVTNVPSYGENTVAEHTFALILALSRKIVASVERTKHGSFDLTGLRGFDLKGKTIGIIGCGKIGQHVARIAAGFEMNILVFDVCKNLQLAKTLQFKYVPLNQLLQQADVVTIHVPYNQHTHHLIGKKELALMKPAALLINTSRGGIVDTDALIRALKSKKIAGAGLDVLEEECQMIEERQLLSKHFTGNCNLKTVLENHLLLKLPKVIITPHNAFNTTEALQRILDVTIENINSFKHGKKINVVNSK